MTTEGKRRHIGSSTILTKRKRAAKTPTPKKAPVWFKQSDNSGGETPRSPKKVPKSKNQPEKIGEKKPPEKEGEKKSPENRGVAYNVDDFANETKEMKAKVVPKRKNGEVVDLEAKGNKWNPINLDGH